MSAPLNGDELLAKINPSLRTARTQICLQHELIEQWQEAMAELDAMQESSGKGRLNGPDATALKAQEKRIAALEAKMDEVSPWFEFRAMPIEQYQELLAEHPPREGNQFDLYAGYDRDAVTNELVRQCLIDPVFSDEGWARFLTTCAPSEWGELRSTVIEVNGGSVKPPKSLRESPRLSKSGSDSE